MVPAEVHTLLALLGDARVAGGAVRDALLGVQPKDWDVATSLVPTAVQKLANDAGFAVLPTGLQHGTVTVMVNKMPLEVTTLRVDVDTDGRHAEVSFTDSWTLDAERRDLTMNSMFMDADGTVWDFFNGQADLANGVVKFVGSASKRVQEDFLRILRFFRFVGRMGSVVFDADAVRAIQRNATGLQKVSGERVWMELEKILTGNNLEEVLLSMQETGVLSVVGVSTPNVEAAVRANAMNARAETVLAALVDTVEVAEVVANAWKLSNHERTTLMFVTANSDNLHHLDHKVLVDWQKMVVVYGKDVTLELMRLTPNHAMVVSVDGWVVPVFPVNGQHMTTLGVKPGPEMGRKLKALKQAWLDSDFKLDLRKMMQMASTI
jgi:tRNA nucleotidyltransferase (CCA-adding enzyme)